MLAYIKADRLNRNAKVAQLQQNLGKESDISLSELNVQHFMSLYESVISLSERLDEMEAKMAKLKEEFPEIASRLSDGDSSSENGTLTRESESQESISGISDDLSVSIRPRCSCVSR